MVTEDICVLLQDFVTPRLLDSPFTPTGVFSMFAIFSVAGFFFIYYYVPETKGLSEQEKKGLFLPGASYGRKLKPGENPAWYTTNDSTKLKDDGKKKRLNSDDGAPFVLGVSSLDDDIIQVTRARSSNGGEEKVVSGLAGQVPTINASLLSSVFTNGPETQTSGSAFNKNE